MSTTTHYPGHLWLPNPNLPPQYQHPSQYQPPHPYPYAPPSPHAVRPPPPPPPPAGHPDRHYSSPNSELSPGANSDESIFVRQKAAYDNPLAGNAAWSPTREDFELCSLPKVDIMLRVKARLNRKAGNPFDPAPRSFQRAPRLTHNARRPFQPIILQSDGKTGLIGAGFKPTYVGPVLAPHDVSAAERKPRSSGPHDIVAGTDHRRAGCRHPAMCAERGAPHVSGICGRA